MTLEQILARFTKKGDCWLWAGNVMACGYGRVQYEQKPWRVHRLMYTLYKCPIPKGLFVCHTCDTPLCGNPEHLFLGTPKENHHDAMEKGRHTKGTKVNTCRLTEEIVLEIRSRWLDESKKYGAYSRLAKEYGVTDVNIRCIVHRVSWKHI